MHGDYSVGSFGDMVADSVRMNAYIAALTKVVTPGCTVLDLGAGTGVLALIACRLGAAKVIAVEVNSAILLGKGMAEANGYGERIQFHHGTSQELTLAERVDVLVSDLHGALPWFGPHQATIADARKRFLKPGGVQIPQRDQIWAALVSASNVHDLIVGPWAETPLGLDLTSALPFANNRWLRNRFTADQVVSPPQSWAVLDYTNWESPHAVQELSWTLTEDVMVHGMGAWFDSTLIEGIGFSNSPASPRAIYAQAFFPWPEAVRLREGDTVHMALRVHLLNGDYLYAWNTAITRESCRIKHFQQSSFNALPISNSQLSKLSDQVERSAI